MPLNVERIRKGVDRLRRSPRRVFGHEGHSYEFGPVLAEELVRAFEDRHAIRLPDDYRTFLTVLGNGGLGPGYGIFPLGLMDDLRDLGPWEGSEWPVRSLASPFPFVSAWNLPTERFECPEGTLEDEDAFNEALDREYQFPLDGAFPINHEGCALRHFLVVTGVERGNVWLDSRADYRGLMPCTAADGRHLSFGEWYLEWLERALIKTGAPPS